MSTLSTTDKQRIKDALRHRNVKLWKDPFTQEDGSANIPSGLVSSIASDIEMDSDVVAEIIEDIRQHSVRKASKRDEAPRSFSLSLFRSGHKKRQDLAQQMVSFENDAFFMAQERSEQLKPKHPDEEPAYFDDLTPEQQAEFDRHLKTQIPTALISSTTKVEDSDRTSTGQDEVGLKVQSLSNETSNQHSMGGELISSDRDSNLSEFNAASCEESIDTVISKVNFDDTEDKLADLKPQLAANMVSFVRSPSGSKLVSAAQENSSTFTLETGNQAYHGNEIANNDDEENDCQESIQCEGNKEGHSTQSCGSFDAQHNNNIDRNRSENVEDLDSNVREEELDISEKDDVISTLRSIKARKGKRGPNFFRTFTKKWRRRPDLGPETGKKREVCANTKHVHRAIIKPSSELKANEMKMTDQQRIAVMTMVRDGRLSVDEAIARVLAVEELLGYGAAATCSSLPSDSSETASLQLPSVTYQDNRDAAEQSNTQIAEDGNTKASHEMEESITTNCIGDAPRISDEKRTAIMMQAKLGRITMDEAINKILDIEMEMKRAQDIQFVLDKVPTVFSAEEIAYINETLKHKHHLRHDTLSRPKVAHRKPNRKTLRQTLLHRSNETNLPSDASENATFDDANEKHRHQEVHATDPKTINSSILGSPDINEVSLETEYDATSECVEVQSDKGLDSQSLTEENAQPNRDLAISRPCSLKYAGNSPKLSHQKPHSHPEQPVVLDQDTMEKDLETNFKTEHQGVDDTVAFVSKETGAIRGNEFITESAMAKSHHKDDNTASKLHHRHVRKRRAFKTQATRQHSEVQPSTIPATPIHQWLNDIGLGTHAQAFLDHGFDAMEFVDDISKDDLDAMGINDTADQQQILEHAMKSSCQQQPLSTLPLDSNLLDEHIPTPQETNMSADIHNANAETKVAMPEQTETYTVSQPSSLAINQMESSEHVYQDHQSLDAENDNDKDPAIIEKATDLEKTTPSVAHPSPSTQAGSSAMRMFKASELHLTKEQQLQVMNLVKSGKLTVDEAVYKVLELEDRLNELNRPPEVDKDGFTIIKQNSTNPFASDPDELFKVTFNQKEDSDMDDDDDDDYGDNECNSETDARDGISSHKNQPQETDSDSDSDDERKKKKRKFKRPLKFRINAEPIQATDSSIASSNPFFHQPTDSNPVSNKSEPTPFCNNTSTFADQSDGLEGSITTTFTTSTSVENEPMANQVFDNDCDPFLVAMESATIQSDTAFDNTDDPFAPPAESNSVENAVARTSLECNTTNAEPSRVESGSKFSASTSSLDPFSAVMQTEARNPFSTLPSIEVPLKITSDENQGFDHASGDAAASTVKTSTKDETCQQTTFSEDKYKKSSFKLDNLPIDENNENYSNSSDNTSSVLRQAELNSPERVCVDVADTESSSNTFKDVEEVVDDENVHGHCNSASSVHPNINVSNLVDNTAHDSNQKDDQKLNKSNISTVCDHINVGHEFFEASNHLLVLSETNGSDGHKEETFMPGQGQAENQESDSKHQIVTTLDDNESSITTQTNLEKTQSSEQSQETNLDREANDSLKGHVEADEINKAPKGTLSVSNTEIATPLSVREESSRQEDHLNAVGNQSASRHAAMGSKTAPPVAAKPFKKEKYVAQNRETRSLTMSTAPIPKPKPTRRDQKQIQLQPQQNVKQPKPVSNAVSQPQQKEIRQKNQTQEQERQEQLRQDNTKFSKPEANMTPADSNMGRSKIFQALNPRPLWAESEEDKQKKESRKTYISLGQNSRGLSSLYPRTKKTDTIHLASADRQIEQLRAEAQASMEAFNKATGQTATYPSSQKERGLKQAQNRNIIKNTNPFALSQSPDSNSCNDDNSHNRKINLEISCTNDPEDSSSDFESFSGTRRSSISSNLSINFDEDFMAELERRREQRAEQERLRAQQLREEYLRRVAEEESARASEFEQLQKELEEKRRKQEAEKEQAQRELMERANEIQFEFKFE